MQQLISVWQGLEARRRVLVVLATVIVFAAVLSLTRIAATPSMSLLYAGLDGSRAGEVVAALDQRAVAFEVRGDAIYVDSSRRDELRMTLAAEGLPANSGMGYELLDGLSGFGTTSQMFDAAYLRAKEGELASTISALPAIRSARVHIAEARAQGLRSQARPTASIVVMTAAGGLTPTHAKALKYLVSSAVAGMSPEDVSVIDGNGNLVPGGDETPSSVGDDRAETIRRNVERLLEARVGYGNAVVEVSIDTVTEREAITERRFDPDSRVAISTDTLETTNSANDSGNNAVTVASNLPEGEGAGNRSSQSNNSETRERTNFEVSETTREVLRTPGAIRRLTVAVLVDGVTGTDAAGMVTHAPRSDEELAARHELVAAAVGFDAERGDVISLKSMDFEPLAVPDAEPRPTLLSSLRLNVMNLIQLAVLALVSLLLGLFVLRPILNSRVARAPGLPAPEVRRATAQRPLASDPEVLTGEIDEGDYVPQKMAAIADGAGGGNGAAAPPRAQGSNGEDPVSRLRQLISERQEETVEILRGWMESSEEERA